MAFSRALRHMDKSNEGKCSVLSQDKMAEPGARPSLALQQVTRAVSAL